MRMFPPLPDGVRRLEVEVVPTAMLLPFFESVPAGFLAPAGDNTGASLNLNELCIRNPASTIFVKVRGDSMKGAGIFDGDILIVDRSLPPIPGNVVIAIIDGEFTVKRLYQQGSHVFLLAENLDYPPIFVEKLEEFVIWGVVTRAIHFLR